MLNVAHASSRLPVDEPAVSADVAMCATGKSGLGHLRRITNVATALRRLLPNRSIMLVSNAPADGMHDGERLLYSDVICAERAQMARSGPVGSARITVVDTAVLPGLDEAPGKLCLILRETLPERLKDFQLANGRAWDLILVPNPRECWMPPEGAIAASRIEPVGWIYRSLARQDRACVMPRASSPKRVLVASGGGGNSETADYLTRECSRIVSGLRERHNGPLHVAQAIGPRSARTGRVAGCDDYFDPGPRLNEYFNRFDLVVSTAGYNSVLELAQIDRPVILMPVARTYDNQTERAVQWAARLGHAHLPGMTEETADWASQALQCDLRRKPCDLGPTGGPAAAAMILELLR